MKPEFKELILEALEDDDIRMALDDAIKYPHKHNRIGMTADKWYPDKGLVSGSVVSTDKDNNDET